MIMLNLSLNLKLGNTSKRAFMLHQDRLETKKLVKFLRASPAFTKLLIHIDYSPAGRSVWEKLCPRSWIPPEAGTQDRGHSFS